jgi:hypothetical protein
VRTISPVGRASVGSEEDIPHRVAKPVGNPALRQVMAAILDHVTALAEVSQIAEPIVFRVFVEMRGG